MLLPFFPALQPEGCADTLLSCDGIFVELLLEASKLGSCSVWQFLVLLPGHQNSYSSMAGQGRAAREAGTSKAALQGCWGKLVAVCKCQFARGCFLGAWAGGGCGDAVSEVAVVLFWSRE